MKQVKLLIIAAISCLGCLIAYAQDAQKIPRWVSEKGYWVVESNIHTPLNHTVRFYTLDDVLVYKETVNGKRLNTNKTSVKMKLKKILESTITAWEKRRQAGEELALVSSALE